MSGIAHGGRQPIAGQAIYVYAAGTGGYGTASTSLLNSTTVATNNASGTYGTDINGNTYVLTDVNGNFTIPAGDYTCTTGQQVYLYGLGQRQRFADGRSRRLPRRRQLCQRIRCFE